MRIFKTTELAFLLFSILVSSSCAPNKIPSSEEPSESPELIGEHYDQRQNGTENYRIHVDGLILVVAPAEALLLAGGGLPGLPGADSGIFGIASQDGTGMIEKPKPEEPPKPEPKPEEIASRKPSHGDSQPSHRFVKRIL